MKKLSFVLLIFLNVYVTASDYKKITVGVGATLLGISVLCGIDSYYHNKRVPRIEKIYHTFNTGCQIEDCVQNGCKNCLSGVTNLDSLNRRARLGDCNAALYQLIRRVAPNKGTNINYIIHNTLNNPNLQTIKNQYSNLDPNHVYIKDNDLERSIVLTNKFLHEQMRRKNYEKAIFIATPGLCLLGFELYHFLKK